MARLIFLKQQVENDIITFLEKSRASHLFPFNNYGTWDIWSIFVHTQCQLFSQKMNTKNASEASYVTKNFNFN